MTAADYRTIILQRMKDRDRACAQFSRVFSSYNALAESMNHLVAKNNRLLSRKRSTTTSAEGEADEDETEALRVELAEVYKQKARNDQLLIDSNRNLAEMEKRLAKVTEERDAVLAAVEDLKLRMTLAQREVEETSAANQLLKDEFLALQLIYEAIQDKYMKADSERAELIDRLKELKENEIEMLNQYNDREQQRHMERIRSALEDASKPNTPTSTAFDTKAFEALGAVDNDGGGGGSSHGAWADHFGDILPESCKIKFECNELGEVNDCLFHPNGRVFFTAGADKKIKMWESGHDSCTKKAVFTGANMAITRIDIDPECKQLLASSSDTAVRVWSIDDQRHRFAFTGHSDKVNAAKFFSTGRMIASGSCDRTVKVWDIVTNRCSRTFFAGSTVFDIACNDRFGAPIISAHFDKSVRFWDVRSEEPANSIHLNGKVTSLFVAVDGQTLLCSSRDETLSLIDLRNYAIVHIYSAEQYRTSYDCGKCVISPGGRYVAAGSADGHIFVWNTVTTKLEKVLYKGGHENSAVLSLAWHPSGHLLISGDKRKNLCIWR